MSALQELHRLRPRAIAAAGAALAAVALVLTVLAPAAVAAADCRVSSLPEIEDEVMCPICGVPLVNAGGQQAENQRDFIRDLVDQCKTTDEIKAALVDEYGDEVLAMPKKDGFGLAAYVVPIAGVALAALGLAFGVVRWRRSEEPAGASAGATESQAGGPDLDADLRRYDL